MRKSDIIKAVEHIRDMDDEEYAHRDEDSLRKTFIEYVAQRKDSLGEKARLVLSTSKIDFARFCA